MTTLSQSGESLLIDVRAFCAASSRFFDSSQRGDSGMTKRVPVTRRPTMKRLRPIGIR